MTTHQLLIAFASGFIAAALFNGLLILSARRRRSPFGPVQMWGTGDSRVVIRNSDTLDHIAQTLDHIAQTCNDIREELAHF